MAMGRRVFFSCLILGLVIKPTVPAAGTVNLSVARWRSDYIYISRDWFTASHFYSIWRSTTRLFRRGPAWLPCIRSPSWIRPQVLGWIFPSLMIFLKVFSERAIFLMRDIHPWPEDPALSPTPRQHVWKLRHPHIIQARRPARWGVF